MKVRGNAFFVNTGGPNLTSLCLSQATLSVGLVSSLSIPSMPDIFMTSKSYRMN